MEESMKNTYKFRAECSADAQAIRAVLQPWLLAWKESREALKFEGGLYSVPDVEVEFSVVEGGPMLDEMLWLLDCINNCHVAAETLNFLGHYSGERSGRAEFTWPAKRPRREILSQAIDAIRARHRVLNLELERALQLHGSYSTAAKLGDKWQPRCKDEPHPGWITPVEHPATGLTAIRRISAPLGLAKWKKHGDQIVCGRLLTISG